MERSRKRQLRELNIRAWNGEKEIFPISDSLDSSLKRNTAFIKRLRTAIIASSTAAFLQDIRSLSLHKYLSEVISASYEGLCKLKTPGDISAGIEVISALHQRFGPGEFTAYLGWLLGRGLSTPDKSQLKALGQDAKEKEEKDRLGRQRVLLKVATELWLVGVLRSLDDVARPEDATGRGKENVGPAASKTGEAAGKLKAGQNTTRSDRMADAEPFPLEVLKDLLGHDRDHTNLPLVVIFVKSFAWDILGITTSAAEASKAIRPKEALPVNVETGYQSSADEDSTAAPAVDDPPLTTQELQRRFKNVLDRYFEDVKLHIVKDHRSIIAQARRNAEAYVKSGEVFEDRQANHDKQLRAQERLISNAQVLCAALESQEMPDLKEQENQAGGSSTGIGLVKTGEYLRGQAEGSGIWEDEDERRFYENLIDLQERVPGVLLEDGKKKKVDGDEPPGKVSEQTALDREATGSPERASNSDIIDDQSTAIANKTVGAQVDALLARLPELQNKEMVDQVAIDFCFLNSKASRNRLIKALQDIPKGRSDLLPLYSRLVATLGKHMPDISSSLVNYLDTEFRSLQRRKQKDFLGQVRMGNIRYLAELTKFGVVPEHVIFHCLKVSLDDFTKMNIDIICSLLENCGRYLLRNPDTSPRMSSFLETLHRKKAAQVLGQQERMLIENAMYYVSPPERAAIEQKEKTPMHQFISKLVYLDMNKRSYMKVSRSLRKLHWEEKEVVNILEKVFSKPGKVKFGNINLLAFLVSHLARYRPDFHVLIIDNIIESITLGLEQNDFKSNQRRIAEVKYLAELYCYKLVESSVIFDTLFRLLSFGHLGGTPGKDQINPLDMPDDYFRILLVCTMLDVCGVYFERGATRKKLDFFLTFFQYYICTKDPLPMDIDFIIHDTFVALRPHWKIVKDLEEAGRAFAEQINQYYKAQEVGKPSEPEPIEEETLSDEDADNEEILVPEMEDGQSSAEEAETEPLVNGEPNNDADFEEDIVVTRQEEERDPDAEAEFDRELAKMMAESLDSRKLERKPLFDVPLPMRRKQRETSTIYEESSNEGTGSTMAFSLMTRKGNRQQTRTIEMPSDSQFAVAMKSQKEAERAEQQRIKNLVLNYDLTDSSADPSGIDGEKYLSPHHQHNSSLQQSSTPNQSTNTRSSDRTSSNRRSQQARKLQLSDVGWT